jgi:hypothetical protein
VKNIVVILVFVVMIKYRYFHCPVHVVKNSALFSMSGVIGGDNSCVHVVSNSVLFNIKFNWQG